VAIDPTKLVVNDNRKPAQTLRIPAHVYVALYRKELEQWLQRKAGEPEEIKSDE